MEPVSDPDDLIEKSLTHTSEYLVEVNGIELWQHPEVLSQEYSYSSSFIVKNWDIAPGMSVLDMGTGNGVLAIFAGLAGARRVVAIDINPFSEMIVKKNIEHHQLGGVVSYLRSDVFAALNDEKFDRIIFNAPYWNKKVDTEHPLTFALNDEHYSVLERFFADAKNFLTKNGKVLLAFSRQGDVTHLENLIQKYNFSIEKLIDETKGHTRLLYFLKSNP